MWRHYYAEDIDNIQAKADCSTDIYTRMNGRGRRYHYSHREAEAKIRRHSVTVIEQENGILQVQEVGCGQVK